MLFEKNLAGHDSGHLSTLERELPREYKPPKEGTYKCGVRAWLSGKNRA